MSTAEDETPNPHRAMRSIIQRIATGPELSKSISFEEARLGMQLVLDEAVDPVQSGIFLIALRMKRETDDENRGVLQALMDAMTRVTAPVDEVVDIADPYNGYTRGLPVSPFLPAVLATCGVPCISHGVDAVGPKFGATHRKVLQAAEVNVDLSPQAAADRVGNPDIGWSYIDQRAFCPKLHDLVKLRTLIVKRPCVTTAEVLLGPIRGRAKTHLVTGYVHKPYPPIYAMLARHAGFDSAVLVRGVEGGVVPSLKQPSKFFYYRDGDEEVEVRVTPADVGIESATRAVPLPPDLPTARNQNDAINTAVDADALARAAAETGIAALQGASGPGADSLTYSAAICLTHLGRFASLRDSANAVRKVLAAGQAFTRLQA